MTADELDLGLKLADVKARQGKPAAPSFGTGRKHRNRDGANLPDVATRAAGDYDPDDLARPAPPPKIPEHLRQYLVDETPAEDGRLARSERQLGGTKLEPVVIGNAHGWLGCDWPGLFRMADARRRAGLPLDDLDVEALKRGDTMPTEEPWNPPTPPSSSSSSPAPPSTPSASPPAPSAAS